MTPIYKHTKSGCLLRYSDGAIIPFDSENSDYLDYLKWVEEGGVPIPVDTPSRESLENKIWEEIKELRTKHENGGVLVNGYWFNTDIESRVKFLGLKDKAKDILAAGGSMSDYPQVAGKSVLWKTLTGQFVPITCQIAFDVVHETGELDGKVFGVAEQHRLNMQDAVDPLSYDYTKGWPTSFEESKTLP